MSLTTPTTAEINNNIIAQLEASLSESIPFLPKVFERVLAKALAGVFILLYKYAGYIFLQMFVQTASNQETTILGKVVNPLVFWGELIGVGAPSPGTQAELSLTVTVTNQVGSLPSGSALLGDSNGVTYVTLGSVLLNAPTVTVTVRAVADQSGGGGYGVIGNLDPGDTVSFADPLDNVVRNTVVLSEDVTGANPEATEVYRQRILDRFQKRPQGGAYADYEAWGEEVAGSINVYPYTGDPGEVNVYSEATVESSGSADGIPTAAQLTAVLDSINSNVNGVPNRRNVNAFVNSNPITRQSFDVTVTGITGVDDLPQVESDVDTAVKEYFLEAEPFIDGLTVSPRTDKLTSTKLTGIVDDIVSAANGTFTSLTMELTSGGGAITEYTLAEGEKAKSTDVTFN